MRFFKKIPLHLWVALSNWLSRAGSVSAQLVCLPLLTTLLTPKEFAAYAIAVSLMTWYQLSDFGFGNSTQNHIAEARAHNKDIGPLIAATSLLGAAVLALAVILLIPGSLLLNQLLLRPINLPDAVHPQLMLWMSGVLLVGFALGTMAQKMLYAMQKGVYANLLGLFNSLGFLGLLWGVARDADSSERLLACVLAYTLPMGLTGIVSLSWLAYKYGHWDWHAIKNCLGLSRVRAWRFWLFAFLAACTLNVDYVIMSRTLSAEDIGVYNVLFRVYWVGMALYSGLLTATWSVFTALGAQGDFVAIGRQVRLYLLSGMGALILGSAVMAIFLPEIMQLLAPGLNIQVTYLTLALFTTYIAFRIWTDTYAVALQALSEVNVFLIIVPVQALVSITGQWFLSKAFGLNGILMGLILSFVLTVAWLLPYQLKQRFRVNSTAVTLPL